MTPTPPIDEVLSRVRSVERHGQRWLVLADLVAELGARRVHNLTAWMRREDRATVQLRSVTIRSLPVLAAREEAVRAYWDKGAPPSRPKAAEPVWSPSDIPRQDARRETRRETGAETAAKSPAVSSDETMAGQEARSTPRPAPAPVEAPPPPEPAVPTPLAPPPAPVLPAPPPPPPPPAPVRAALPPGLRRVGLDDLALEWVPVAAKPEGEDLWAWALPGHEMERFQAARDAGVVLVTQRRDLSGGSTLVAKLARPTWGLLQKWWHAGWQAGQNGCNPATTPDSRVARTPGG